MGAPGQSRTHQPARQPRFVAEIASAVHAPRSSRRSRRRASGCTSGSAASAKVWSRPLPSTRPWAASWPQRPLNSRCACWPRPLNDAPWSPPQPDNSTRTPCSAARRCTTSSLARTCAPGRAPSRRSTLTRPSVLGAQWKAASPSWRHTASMAPYSGAYVSLGGLPAKSGNQLKVSGAGRFEWRSSRAASTAMLEESKPPLKCAPMGSAPCSRVTTACVKRDRNSSA